MSEAKTNSLRANKIAAQSRKSRKAVEASAMRDVQDQKDREAAGRAYDKAMGFKNGGMVKMTPKTAAYRCGGMVKGK